MIGTTNVKVKPNKQVDYVEYIESTGTQYIDTGFIPTTNSKFELDIQYTSIPTGNGVNDSYRNGIGGVTSNSRFACGYNNTGFYYGLGETNLDMGYGDTNIHTFIVDLKNMQYGYDSNLDSTNAVFSNPNNVTFTLFARNMTGLRNPPIDSYSKQKLYSAKIYENEVLVRDFRPCKDGAGVYCLYEKVEKRYYYNQGTGNFIGDGYEPTQLAYIESSGTQYIDTGHKATSNTSIEIDFQIIGAVTTDSWQPFFGFRRYNVTSRPDFAGYYDVNDKRMLLFAHSAEQAQTTLSEPVSNRTQLKFDNAGVYDKNGNKIISVTKTEFAETDYSMLLFALRIYNNSGNVLTIDSRRPLMKLYGFKIYEDGVLVKDFVPALGHNDIVCLYDKVTKTCFYNAGTGEFGGVI